MMGMELAARRKARKNEGCRPQAALRYVRRARGDIRPPAFARGEFAYATWLLGNRNFSTPAECTYPEIAGHKAADSRQRSNVLYFVRASPLGANLPP